MQTFAWGELAGGVSGQVEVTWTGSSVNLEVLQTSTSKREWQFNLESDSSGQRVKQKTREIGPERDKTLKQLELKTRTLAESSGDASERPEHQH